LTTTNGSVFPISREVLSDYPFGLVAPMLSVLANGYAFPAELIVWHLGQVHSW